MESYKRDSEGELSILPTLSSCSINKQKVKSIKLLQKHLKFDEG